MGSSKPCEMTATTRLMGPHQRLWICYTLTHSHKEDDCPGVAGPGSQMPTWFPDAQPSVVPLKADQGGTGAVFSCLRR